MSIADWIVLLLLIVIVGAAIRYIRIQKKKGAHCIGCPQAGSCPKCSCQKES